jgi:hypothetical protein
MASRLNGDHFNNGIVARVMVTNGWNDACFFGQPNRRPDVIPKTRALPSGVCSPRDGTWFIRPGVVLLQSGNKIYSRGHACTMSERRIRPLREGRAALSCHLW